MKTGVKITNANESDDPTSDFSSRCERMGQPAAATEPPKSATSPPIWADDRARRASKWQKYRKRQARGEIVLRVVADEHSLADALVSAGWLNDNEALDRNRIAEAAG